MLPASPRWWGGPGRRTSGAIDELDALASDAEGDEADDLHAQADALRDEMDIPASASRSPLSEEQVERSANGSSPRTAMAPPSPSCLEQIVSPVMTCRPVADPAGRDRRGLLLPDAHGDMPRFAAAGLAVTVPRRLPSAPEALTSRLWLQDYASLGQPLSVFLAGVTRCGLPSDTLAPSRGSPISTRSVPGV